MRKITKKVLKRIKEGYHDDLMDAIEFLIDSYDDDRFEAGYKCRIGDEAVVGYRLAEYIHEQSDKQGKLGKDKNGEPISYMELDETAQCIEDYFNNALNNGK
jgi:hypothetical protein